MEVVGDSGNVSTGIAPAMIEQLQMTFNRVAADLKLTSYLTSTEALRFHLVAEHAYILHPYHHLPCRSGAGPDATIGSHFGTSRSEKEGETLPNCELSSGNLTVGRGIAIAFQGGRQGGTKMIRQLVFAQLSPDRASGR